MIETNDAFTLPTGRLGYMSWGREDILSAFTEHNYDNLRGYNYEKTNIKSRLIPQAYWARSLNTFYNNILNAKFFIQI